jgi:hypothetical protein
MTVDFSAVSIGDRVRLTRENPHAITEFDVTYIMPTSDPTFLQQKIEGGLFEVYRNDWDTLEILPKPLPSEPGLYVPNEYLGSVWSATLYIRDNEGIWMSDSGGTWTVLSESEVPRNLVKLVKA